MQNVFDLHISVKLARTLFRTPNASQFEIDSKLIVYERNKEAFLVMMECLDINNEEEFTLDFKLYKERV